MRIITACPAQKEAEAILAVQDSPDPVLADDGVLVSVAAAGVNPADLLQVAGAYPPPPGAPSWPGLEVAGLIVATGPLVRGCLPTGAELTFVLADTGVAGSTRTAVDAVRRVRETEPDRFAGILARLTAIAHAARTALATGDRATVGSLMDESHLHLAALGVSGPELDTLAAAARTAGALGAKLTGGGLGGCLLALAPDLTTAEHVAAELRAAGATAVHTSTTEAFA